MERLKKRDEYGNADIIGVSSDAQFELSFDELNSVTNALNRLAAYEDTGLAPEEILTGKELAEIAIGLQQLNRIRSVFSDERMEELMQAEKEGRITIRPPSTPYTQQALAIAGSVNLFTQMKTWPLILDIAVSSKR